MKVISTYYEVQINNKKTGKTGWFVVREYSTVTDAHESAKRFLSLSYERVRVVRNERSLVEELRRKK